jgi:hypothetical protein
MDSSDHLEKLEVESGNESPIHRSSKAMVAVNAGLAAPPAEVNPKP